jgi:hypothetical protein
LTTVGECVWNVITGRKIILDQVHWQEWDDASKESLLFHELGHCVLHRAHRLDTVQMVPPGDTVATTFSASLMNPTFVDGATHLQFKDYYLNELFTVSQPSL